METESFRARAERVINGAFGGEHHVLSLKWGDGFCTFLVNELSTYDYPGMTMLVVYCHDECVRGDVRNGGPGRLKISLSNRERKHKHPDSGAHPTLDQHVEQIRKGGSYRDLHNQLREE